VTVETVSSVSTKWTPPYPFPFQALCLKPQKQEGFKQNNFLPKYAAMCLNNK